LQRPASQRESTGAQAFSDVRVSRQATTLQLPCEYNAYEECNALDDDCNGVIDDQCGYESGAVQITVGWNSGADIDLYVTDPSGATLYYNELHKRSRLGGHLDHDARGDCRKEQANPRIENAYWPSARAGTYRVELHYFSPCAQTAATEATLSVVVRGQLLGAYRVRLEPEQRVEAVSFVMQ
jgi:tRNA (guanosine-2'-O-)-methyltransferase